MNPSVYPTPETSPPAPPRPVNLTSPGQAGRSGCLLELRDGRAPGRAQEDPWGRRLVRPQGGGGGGGGGGEREGGGGGGEREGGGREVEVGDGFKRLKNKGVEWSGVRRDEWKEGEMGRGGVRVRRRRRNRESG